MHDNLDNEGELRFRQLSEIAREYFDDNVLWDTFGLAPDVTVSLHQRPKYSVTSHLSSEQPYTSYFPRADIHELISPDILHQLIKGTFKDHLVAWVEDYLTLTHGLVEAKRIMDDIDRR